MRRTWLSSALPAGLRFGTRSFATRVNGLVVRPERQLQIEEFAKLFPLILSDDRIPPGLSKSRIRAGSNVMYVFWILEAQTMLTCAQSPRSIVAGSLRSILHSESIYQDTRPRV